jgi:acetolactate synthase-1/2/3 large subunit
VSGGDAGGAQKMSGARALAQMLDGYGVTHFFMVPAILRQTMVELEEHTSIRRIHAHGEKAAAYMADGYARISRRPGVCGAQVIGALNLAAGLRDAYLAHAPVIALTGGRDPATKFRMVYQEVDDVPAFDNVTKLNATVDAVERIPDMVRQAFRAAVTGCPGPVHLQFRGNEGQLDAAEAELDPWVETTAASYPAHRVPPDDTAIGQALAALARAERPVLVAGGGVRASGAGPELVALAERLRIPVVTSLNGKDSITGSHPLNLGVVGSYSRESANRIVSEADLVGFVGTQTGGMTTHFWQVPPLTARAIQIDIDPENLGRNYRLEAAVLADAQLALRRMLELSEPQDRPSAARTAWAERAAAVRAQWYADYDGVLHSDAVPIRPERICADLSDALPSDAIVVVDTGHGGMWMGGMYDLHSPEQSYVRSAGHLGWAFPAGLGAKCAAPDRPVAVFTGDAGFWYHIGELETAVRWGISSVTIVNNNASGNQSKRGFDRVYGGTQTDEGKRLWTFTDVDFAAVATAVGALGIRVTRPQDFQPALERALASGRPAVIDVVTDINALAPLAIS